MIDRAWHDYNIMLLYDSIDNANTLTHSPMEARYESHTTD